MGLDALISVGDQNPVNEVKQRDCAHVSAQYFPTIILCVVQYQIWKRVPIISKEFENYGSKQGHGVLKMKNMEQKSSKYEF